MAEAGARGDAGGDASSRSFRARLALRFTATMTVGIVLVAAVSHLAIREILDRELDASILNVASIQAASVTSAPDGEMEFHEWELTPEEAASVRELNRYAQVWSVDGRSLLRTRYITRDLPVDTAALRAAGVEGELTWEEGTFQGIPVRSLFYPLERFGPSHERHVLQVAAPLTGRNEMLRTVALLLSAIVLLVSGGTFVGSWWLAGSAVEPVHEITDQAEEIGHSGLLDSRIGAYADTREYQRLVQVLNTMLDRIEAAFEAQRRFTADASHELRSPLTALRGELELARRRERSPGEYRRVIDSALEEVDRLSRLTEDLLTLARSDAGVMEPRLRETDLAERVRRVADRLETRADEKDVRLRVEADGPAPGLFDPDLVDRLLWNLVENAIEFGPGGSEVSVSLDSRNGTAVLEVSDDGPGIPPGSEARIFDRFYQADESRTAPDHGAGTGLGLSIVRAIAEAHRAEVSAGNRPEGGAVFRVAFPVTSPPGGTAGTFG